MSISNFGHFAGSFSGLATSVQARSSLL